MRSTGMDTGPDPALPRELLLRVLRFLPPNTVAFSGRLTCKDAAEHFCQPGDCTICLSQPLPALPSAVEWARDKAQQGLAALSFRRQLRLFKVAARSGSTTNLELVLSVMQPRICPEVLSSGHLHKTGPVLQFEDTGVVAAQSGHAHLLPWLLAHCPGLVDPARALHAVAQHCDLEALQRAWADLGERVVQGRDDSSENPFWQRLLANAA